MNLDPHEEEDRRKDDEDILEITWEDLEDTAEGAELLPALDAADAAVAGSRLPWVEIEAVCGRQHAPFGVRFQESSPGVYGCVGVTPKNTKEQQSGAAPSPGLGQVNAQFSLAAYTGCPLCGMPGLVQCDRCGLVMCGSAVQRDKRGDYCVCPGCGGRGRIESGVAVTVQGEVGGIKGKSKSR